MRKDEEGKGERGWHILMKKTVEGKITDGNIDQRNERGDTDS